MDLNLVVLVGRLTVAPEVRAFDNGGRFMRFLLAVRAEEPKRRLDVLPVTIWDPCDELLANPPEPGGRLCVSGSVQRRFWGGDQGRRSRLEIVADHVSVREQAAVPTS